MFAFTDGVSETLNGKGEEFGEQQIISLIKKNQGRKTEEILDSVINEVISFNNSKSFDDDFTMLLLKAVQ
jgi:serine phosphatase RsbU (regulator of sigma subunit)